MSSPRKPDIAGIVQKEREREARRAPKNKKHIILRLLRYLMRYKWYVFFALLLSVGSNLFALIGPLLSGYALTPLNWEWGEWISRRFSVLYTNDHILCAFLCHVLWTGCADAADHQKGGLFHAPGFV